jgi:hypothetical protein
MYMHIGPAKYDAAAAKALAPPKFNESSDISMPKSEKKEKKRKIEEIEEAPKKKKVFTYIYIYMNTCVSTFINMNSYTQSYM